jgi:hypothetical protein
VPIEIEYAVHVSGPGPGEHSRLGAVHAEHESEVTHKVARLVQANIDKLHRDAIVSI